jgi:hypothetical protein
MRGRATQCLLRVKKLKSSLRAPCFSLCPAIADAASNVYESTPSSNRAPIEKLFMAGNILLAAAAN